ncbi:tRNA(adenine34) deaminase [Deinococcus sp. HSC-46F16]|uniref:nucleoside deaminase n=1 Tax=Deinococcus sp. HSC-46F16 TaxID=2910968 RepID=UPI00209D3A67|nr:tRNA(adenine34) deaminase [Deinococcus sp. HSC-46F16]
MSQGSWVRSPWDDALAEAWAGYCHGSYPIGAVVVDAQGEVIARGRNRLGEARTVERGFISGHDLAHAEINALLNLREVPRPEVYGWTVLTTVEPCPQCAGAIAMSGLRAVEYAAPDPWAGCTRLLTDDPYVARKGIRVGRAPEAVQSAALRLALVGFLEEGHAALESSLLREYRRTHPLDLRAAEHLHASGTLAALRSRQAPFAQARPLLLEVPA